VAKITQRRIRSPNREDQVTAQTLEEYKKRGACGKVFHGYLERRKTPPAIRDIPSNSKEWVFKNGMNAMSTRMLIDANQ
jgi:hypothetical protein